jgi:hypothetical protein
VCVCVCAWWGWLGGVVGRAVCCTVCCLRLCLCAARVWCARLRVRLCVHACMCVCVCVRVYLSVCGGRLCVWLARTRGAIALQSCGVLLPQETHSHRHRPPLCRPVDMQRTRDTRAHTHAHTHTPPVPPHREGAGTHTHTHTQKKACSKKCFPKPQLECKFGKFKKKGDTILVSYNTLP